MKTQTFTNTNEIPVQMLGDFPGSNEDTSQNGIIAPALSLWEW